jgi:hypothetical protein
MYDHAFPRTEFTQKTATRFFGKRAILTQDPSLTLTGSTGLLFATTSNVNSTDIWGFAFKRLLSI